MVCAARQDRHWFQREFSPTDLA